MLSSAFVSFDKESACLWKLDDGAKYLAHTKTQKPIIIFIDPSQHTQAPGWPLRNLLVFLEVRFRITRVQVICWKSLTGGTWDRSVVGTLYLPPSDKSSPTLMWQGRATCVLSRNTGFSVIPEAVGWERNAQNRLAPKMAALGEMMDPYQLADRAMDLNLRLMRWRVAPNLALESIQGTRVLLVGAGTLGCSVARILLGWGVRCITFVDGGRVSFSNPVRQSLYEFKDCLDGGRPKAEAAAEALQRIFPGVQAKGHWITIPMPGHPIPEASMARTNEAITQFEELVDQHDVLFVLTDSRESRWLPTVLGAAKNKVRGAKVLFMISVGDQRSAWL